MTSYPNSLDDYLSLVIGQSRLTCIYGKTHTWPYARTYAQVNAASTKHAVNITRHKFRSPIQKISWYFAQKTSILESATSSSSRAESKFCQRIYTHHVARHHHKTLSTKCVLCSSQLHLGPCAQKHCYQAQVDPKKKKKKIRIKLRPLCLWTRGHKFILILILHLKFVLNPNTGLNCFVNTCSDALPSFKGQGLIRC